MEKPVKIRLHVLSPIHIGCDDVYEPTSFVIDKKRKKLIEFDRMEFVKKLGTGSKRKLSEIADMGTLSSIVEMYRFVFNNSGEIQGREVDISADIGEKYIAVKDMPLNEHKIKQELNNFLLLRTAYLPHDSAPYIPGSSLKGAIRTAHVSTLASRRKKPIEKFWESSRQLAEQDLSNPSFIYRQIGKKRLSNLLEKGLLGIHNSPEPFSDDPFRKVKVSDLIPVGEVKTKIVFAVNKSKSNPVRETRAGGGGLCQMLEVIQPGAIFEGAITSNISELLTNVHAFYLKNRDAEYMKASWMAEKPAVASTENLFFIRLGRHSGAEAVTIEGNRYIKVMQKKGDPDIYLDHATTVWLASDKPRPQTTKSLLPFGWAVIEVLPFDVKAGMYSARKVTIPDTTSDIERKTAETLDSGLKPAGMTEEDSCAFFKSSNVVVEEDNSLSIRLQAVKNQQTFVEFVKGIKMDEIEALKSLSFKDTGISVGVAGELEAADASADIKKIIAQKILEITTPNKKWDEKKHARYKKLCAMAGLSYT